MSVHTEPSEIPTSTALLAAIVQGAEDAIIGKTLDGTILSWNGGAERVFGHSAQEAVGQPITLIFPDERLSEEARIIAKIKSGERYPPYLSVRRRKDGTLIDLSIAVSPIPAEDGRIVGAAKIARDVSPLREEAERQALLARETNHRIKNVFAITSGLVLQSARQADSINGLVLDLNSRLAALARAHELTLPDLSSTQASPQTTTLLRLLDAIIAPYQDHASGRIEVTGVDFEIGPSALTAIALVLHELVTNAAKYGALASPEGGLSISVELTDQVLLLTWIEETGARVLADAGPQGFGSFLETVLKELDASIKRKWNPHGLRIELSIPLTSIKG